ncbi:MAG: diphosphomevalonate decarboxylase [Microgenomates group bacterium]|nr:diphosphomevalonate decarboxylase [Microgenomates group bacterium]
MKATAIAPANIAFIKYWGKKDERLRLPANGSISVNLSNLQTITTVDFSADYQEDIVIINHKKDKKEATRVVEHLNRIRHLAGIKNRAMVVSQNNFPTATGLASSASGFAALTVAAASAASLNLSEKELTILARQGSGSACRSIPDGFVEWFEGKNNETSYAHSIFPADYWSIRIITITLAYESKEVGSSLGHKLALANPFFKTRLLRINEKIKRIKRLIKEKNFRQFGEMIEREALELHAIALTSDPPIIYWQPETVKIINLIRLWRKENLSAYFTIDAGPNIFLVCEEKNLNKLIAKLNKIKEIKKIIINSPSRGTRLISKHLF